MYSKLWTYFSPIPYTLMCFLQLQIYFLYVFTECIILTTLLCLLMLLIVFLGCCAFNIFCSSEQYIVPYWPFYESHPYWPGFQGSAWIFCHPLLFLASTLSSNPELPLQTSVSFLSLPGQLWHSAVAPKAPSMPFSPSVKTYSNTYSFLCPHPRFAESKLWRMGSLGLLHSLVLIIYPETQTPI